MPSGPRNNRPLLRSLIDQGILPVADAPLLWEPAPLPRPPERDMVEGMLLGLAIGDALGNTSESMLPGLRRERYGEIRDFLPNRHAQERAFGLPSDDTQMAFWTLEHLLQHDGLDPDSLAQTFSSRRIFGIGHTVREFVSEMRRGLPWTEASVPSAGNGALMRIAPIVVPHVGTDGSRLSADTVLAAALTHMDSASISSCVAFVGMLWELLAATDVPEPRWWVESFVATSRQVERTNTYHPRGGEYPEFEGTLWEYVQMTVGPAYDEGLDVLTAGTRWFSGAYLLETVPSVLHILMRHGDDAEAAIVRAVNDTKDNDTIAAIVGAAVGALHGRSALPGRWIEGLLGRTGESDNGRVFELIDAALQRWA